MEYQIKYAYAFLYRDNIYIKWGTDQMSALSDLFKDTSISRGHTITCLGYVPLAYGQYAREK